MAARERVEQRRGDGQAQCSRIQGVRPEPGPRIKDREAGSGIWRWWPRDEEEEGVEIGTQVIRWAA